MNNPKKITVQDLVQLNNEIKLKDKLKDLTPESLIDAVSLLKIEQKKRRAASLLKANAVRIQNAKERAEAKKRVGIVKTIIKKRVGIVKTIRFKKTLRPRRAKNE